MEELVSFDTAKLAKEKGFDWMCTDNIYIDSVSRISSPSQSLLQKWLREKHNMHVDLWYNDLTNKWRCEGLYLLPLMEVLSINCNEHPTYEEALEEGLYEALKLVTIK